MKPRSKPTPVETVPEGFVPVVPLKSMVLVPNTVTPLLIGRSGSVAAVEAALNGSKYILCLTQKSLEDSEQDPTPGQLFKLGTFCAIIQSLRLPDDNLRVLVHGEARARATEFLRVGSALYARPKPEEKLEPESSKELTARIRAFKKLLGRYMRLHRGMPEESLFALNELSGLRDLFYYGLANLDVDFKQKQELYQHDELGTSFNRLYAMLMQEAELLQLESRIENKVKKRLGKLQKEYYLQEQLKVIHKELGLGENDSTDIAELNQRLANTPMSEEAGKKAREELKRLANMAPHMPDYMVSYNYITWLLDLPWQAPVNADFSLDKAQTVLDEDHYGLKDVKERILEYLAVVKLAGRLQGQILCLVGPPGVGKTSLGKSVARALNRPFVRISLGGVRDEAEIRGHRRTYIGSLPGVIIQSMKKAGAMNPVFMMDEVDKMSVDFRGDPSSALLEVLDPEQNDQFRDHYLDVGYDLSQVFFITTANTLSSIPQPLLDRMEIIEIPGYTEYEKTNIARRHLLPKLIKKHGTEGYLAYDLTDEALLHIIRSYTREAGVRELERKMSTVLRKKVRRHMADNPVEESAPVSSEQLPDFLGVEKYFDDELDKSGRPGVVAGLAWTSTGGDVLPIEVLRLPGEGKLKLTGKLGEVMKESAEAAYSLTRLFAADYGIEPDFYKKFDIHLHVPEGAVPKDGPSAGVTIFTAMISACSERPVATDLAMTGEITLTGRVLPIGGLAEKLIAAKRMGIKRVLIPKANVPGLREIQDEIKKDIEIIPVSLVGEVLAQALL